MPAQPSASQLLDAFLANPKEAVIGLRPDGTVFLWNYAAQLFYGYTAAEMIGKPADCLLPRYEIRTFKELLAEPSMGAGFSDLPVERVTKQGELVRVHVSRTQLRAPGGENACLLERSHLSRARSAHRAAETHLQFLVAKMPLLFWTTDRNLQITSHWGSEISEAPAPPNGPIGQSVQEYLRCREASESPIRQHFLALQGMSSRFEYTSRKRLYDVSIEPFRGAEGNVIGCIGMALDITERRKTEDEIRYRASHDGLTDLANYREFRESLEREVRRSGRTGQTFALLLLDMDDLKKINDRHGHLAGNRALKRLAQVMKEHCRGTDLAARFGGDEFAILLIDADSGRGKAVAERIQNCLATQQDAQKLSVSIGISVFPQDGPAATDLLEAADKHLYQDKKAAHARRDESREPTQSRQR